MKRTITLLTIIIITAFIAFDSNGLGSENQIDVKLTNGLINRVSADPDSIKIYAGDKDGRFSLLHKFIYKATIVSRFNQWDVLDGRLESIFGQDISSIFNINSDSSRTRYSFIESLFSKNKFIFADLNNDGLPDFIDIEEPSSDNGGFYTHSIYYQNKDGSFSDTPNRVIKERSSSWISGIYYDINKDGIPDKIEVGYKHYGALLSNTKCTISIYLFDNKNNEYRDKPDMRIISTGIFYEKNNLTDVNNDGCPDIFIIDAPKKPHSIEEAISKFFNKHTDIDVKFYLYNKRAGGYPPAPSFIKRINVDVLKDFTISFAPNAQQAQYKNLIVTQSNQSKVYDINQK